MPESSLPYCADCPVSKRLATEPEIATSEPVQQVAGYVEVFANYFNDYVAEGAREKAEQERARQTGINDDQIDLNYNPLAADWSFVESAEDKKEEIIEYLDVLPVGVSVTTLLALGECAHMIASGDCYFTSTLPGFKEIRRKNR